MIRDKKIDALKGYAILLVVLGHSVAKAFPTSYNENLLFQAIYSFHMPLFFLLSGYVSFNKMNNLVYKRFISLIPTYFVWHTLYPLIGHRDIGSIKTFYTNAVLYPDAPWFLPILFACLAVLAVLVYFEKVIGNWSYIMFFAMIYFVPFPYYGQVKWYAPILIIGYLIAKYKDRLTNYQKPVLYISAIGFPFLLLAQIPYLKLPLALTGMALSYFFVNRFFNFGFVRYLGRISLETYLISGMFMSMGFGTGYIDVLSTFLTSTVISVIIIFLIHRSRLLTKVLFGKWPPFRKARTSQDIGLA